MPSFKRNPQLEHRGSETLHQQGATFDIVAIELRARVAVGELEHGYLVRSSVK